MEDTAPEFLTAEEVATRLRVSTRTVNRWARDGRLEVTLTPTGRQRFRSASVEKFLADQSAA